MPSTGNPRQTSSLELACWSSSARRSGSPRRGITSRCRDRHRVLFPEHLPRPNPLPNPEHLETTAGGIADQRPHRVETRPARPLSVRGLAIHEDLVLPPRIKRWSLTSLQQRLVKTGGRLVKHARYYWLLLAEGHLTRRLFGDMLRRIWALPVPGG